MCHGPMPNMKFLWLGLIIVVGLVSGCGNTPAIHLSPKTFIGEWKGNTSQGFPILFQVKEVGGQVQVTGAQFDRILSWGPGVKTTDYMYDPRPIDAEVIKAEFDFVDIDGVKNTKVHGMFTGEKSLIGSIDFWRTQEPGNTSSIPTSSNFEFTTTKQ